MYHILNIYIIQHLKFLTTVLKRINYHNFWTLQETLRILDKSISRSTSHINF